MSDASKNPDSIEKSATQTNPSAARRNDFANGSLIVPIAARILVAVLNANRGQYEITLFAAGIVGVLLGVVGLWKSKELQKGRYLAISGIVFSLFGMISFISPMGHR